MGPRPVGVLPDAWWECVATLWNLITDKGDMPKSWLVVRVVGIDKPGSANFRPFSIASAMYRIGTTTMLRSIRSWICGSNSQAEFLAGAFHGW